MSETSTLVFNTSFVAIDGRALGIEGPPGSGKSSLALALIDRGATLIGDDGAELVKEGARVFAHPPPETRGLIEIRGVGLVEMPAAPPAPLSLILTLANDTERMPAEADSRSILGCEIPILPLNPGPFAPAQRAEFALARFGLI